MAACAWISSVFKNAYLKLTVYSLTASKPMQNFLLIWMLLCIKYLSFFLAN